MTVTVIICTRNRAESLRATLGSIGRTTIPPRWDVELLVVDNGSTDNTVEVVETARLPNFQVRLEPEVDKGQTAARNRGLASASADIVLFTDDDVRVPQNWIYGMCSPIIDDIADAVAGGVIFPSEILQSLSHPTLSQRRTWFASTETLDPHKPERMVGANMAFHRKVLEKVPSFDSELGPGRLGFGDDTLFSKQIQAAKYRLIGALDVAVEHHFDITRLGRQNILSMARRMGRSEAYIFHHWTGGSSRLVVPRLILTHFRRLAEALSENFDGSSMDTPSENSIRVELDLAFYREYLVQRRRPRKYYIDPSSLSCLHEHRRN